jgi:Gpi18-like mannosyltransferase
LKIPAFPSNLIPFLNAKLHPALVKLPSIFAEIGTGWLIYQIILYFGFKKKQALVGSSLFLFNPAIIYNSSVWGQTDGLINFFMLLGIFGLIKKKYLWAFSAIFASFYFKLSLLIFLPVILIYLLKQKTDLKKLGVGLFFSLSFFVLLSLPFIKGGILDWFKTLFLGRILGGQGNMLTANAFNLWAVFFGIDFSRGDGGMWIGVSYKIIGLTLFSLIYLLVLLKLIRGKFTHLSFIFSLALISIFSFLLLTNMHERYLYPAFPYLALLAGMKFIPVWFFVLFSLVHFLNLYNLWFFPHSQFLINIFNVNNQILVKILSGSLLLLGFYFFKIYFLSDIKIKKGSLL